MFDPGVAIVEALDKEAGAVVLASEKEVLARPDRLQKQAELKGPGEALAVSEDQAERFGLARGAVEGDDEFKSRFGLSDRSIVRSRATWVDTLVTTLNTPWMSGFLLFLGIFMLVLEMKMPGIGLPAITAALAFLLFFWSRYLGGTADSLEIILFLVGLVCLALELFVFPGFGVFGMSGVVLVLGSVVMASHTFVWPSDPYEYRLMGRTLLQVIMALLGVLVGGMVVGRYFPSMPLFNRLVLKAMPYGEVDSDNDPFAKPGLEGEISYAYLLGESGRTTTVLRPTGKARFGERLVEVTADGFFIERDSFVEVVEVQGSRVVVRKVSI
jgi:membrane-bound serine protease (ClpP class)